jgi:putative endonuclease
MEIHSEKSSPMWHLYLIRNKLDQLYCGITTDIHRRFEEHSFDPKKGAKALRGKGPLSLEFHIEVGSKSMASKLEHQVKKLKKPIKEALLKQRINTLDNMTAYLNCHIYKSTL